MKLIKLLLFLLAIIGLGYIFYENRVLNPNPVIVWVYPGMEFSLQVPTVILFSFAAGVLIGYFITVIQIFSHKRSISNLKSNVKKLNSELDDLRNQSVKEDIVLIDSKESIDL